MDAETVALARRALTEDRSIAGAYSIGGGNTAVLAAFADAGPALLSLRRP